jgi:hypothetical protein
MEEMTKTDSDDFRTDLSYSYKEGNLSSLLIFFAVLVFFLLPYILIMGWDLVWEDINAYVFNVQYSLPALLGSFLFHEMIHGLFLIFPGGVPLRNIKAGFSSMTLTPYIHCKIPVKVRTYRWGTVAPLILIGIAPCIVAFFTGYTWLIFIGLIMCVSSGSDLYTIYKLRKIPGSYFASDHPDKGGCYVYEDPFADN